MQIRYLTHIILIVEAYPRDLPTYQLQHLGQQVQHPIKADEDRSVCMNVSMNCMNVWMTLHLDLMVLILMTGTQCNRYFIKFMMAYLPDKSRNNYLTTWISDKIFQRATNICNTRCPTLGFDLKIGSWNPKILNLKGNMAFKLCNSNLIVIL